MSMFRPVSIVPRWCGRSRRSSVDHVPSLESPSQQIGRSVLDYPYSTERGKSLLHSVGIQNLGGTFTRSRAVGRSVSVASAATDVPVTGGRGALVVSRGFAVVRMPGESWGQ